MTKKLLSFSRAKRKFEIGYVSATLRETCGNVSKAAILAKKDRKDFYALMHRCGINPNAFRRKKRKTSKKILSERETHKKIVDTLSRYPRPSLK